MPFTLSHAAAALPFRRFKPIWPALIVGTFAPDLQYFIQLTDEDRSGHHFPDVLLFTLPAALLVLWLFESLIKGPVIELLPSGWHRRLHDKIAPLSFRGWRQFGRIVIWISVGTLTHLIWDQFTHPGTRTASYWPLLKAQVWVPLRHSMTLAGALQDASTLLGFLTLCLWCAAWYRRTQPAPKTMTPELPARTKLVVVMTMVFVAVAAGYLLAWYTLAGHIGHLSRSTRVAIIFIAMTQLFCVEMLIYGAAMTWRNRMQQFVASQINQPARFE